MTKGLEARARIAIDAPPGKVWESLTTPEGMKATFFGADVVTEWKISGPIYYRGVWEGKPFEDKGWAQQSSPPHLLVVTHWSPLSGIPEAAENYHTVSFQLTPTGAATEVTIIQDNNASAAEATHSAGNWQMALPSLKRLVEGG